MVSIKKDFIEFGRGKDKKKRKERANIARVVGLGAAIGGAKGYIKGRGGLANKRVRVAEALRQSSLKKANPNDFQASKQGINRYRKIRSDFNNKGKRILKVLDKRAKVGAIKGSVKGAAGALAAYGAYRGIKALKDRKKKESD